MSLLPKLRTKYGANIGVEIFIQFPSLDGNEKSFFDADEAAAQTTLSANGTNFSTDQYIVLGQEGAEKTEIVKTHTSTTPTSTTITTGATVFSHNRGDKIQFIPYNQIVVERSTDSGANFTPLSAVDIRPDATETYLQRTGDASTDVYRVRFYNSTSALYSAYSDNTTASGYSYDTVYSVKYRALRALGEKIDPLITDEFLNDQLFEARRELDQDARVLRWSFRTKFNTDIGNCIPGRYSVSAPTDLRDPNTNKNILAIRIGRDGQQLEYQDFNRFSENYWNIGHTTLNGAIITSDTSITLTSSGDFDESGSVYIAGESVSDVIDTVSYTANNESTNVISGVTGIVAAGHATARDVWQGVNFGLPVAYTIHDGVVYFDVPFEDDLAGENIYMDYYSTLTSSDSDSDTLDEPEVDLFVSYLKAKIKYLKSNGKLNLEQDGDYVEWQRRKNDLIAKHVTAQRIYFYPDENY